MLCKDYTKTDCKFEALIVCDVLGSVFVFGDVFGRVFDFGDLFGSTSDVNKPMVCLHIWYGDVFESMFILVMCLGARLILVTC